MAAEPCVHHADIIRHLQMQDKIIDMQDKTIEATDHKANLALEKYDQVAKDQIATEIYTKELYKTTDRVIEKVDDLTTEIRELVVAMAKNNQDTSNNTKFTNKGKDLVYEIIKYIVIAAVAYNMGGAG